MSYCMHTLFSNSKFQEILEKFPDPKDYGDNGAVSQCLQREYNISATFANRAIVLSLKDLIKTLEKER